jgi:hypothetical protein
MGRSLFALVRGRDGRSLALALAVIVTLNTALGGFAAGAMASGNQGLTLCDAATTAGGLPPLNDPRNSDDCACCVFGCSAGCTPVAGTVPERHAPGLPEMLHDDAVALPVAVQALPAPRLIRPEGPRGPPSSA